MDLNHFDQLARALMRVPSRRHVLQSLAGVGLGLATARPSQLVEAKKRRNRKKRKPRTPSAPPLKLNEYGCVNVDDPCTSADQCCSGICEGTKGNRTCRAHDTGDCEAGLNLEICGGEDDIICTNDSGDEGYCGMTTGNAAFCIATGECYPCRKDVECQHASNGFYGPTAACVRCTGCAETGGTACFMAEFP